MDDYEFGKPILSFMTVGTLRKLLKNYPDRTPITVCGTPGLFYPDENQQYILLETMDCGEYDSVSDLHSTVFAGQEYIDF